MMVTCSQQSKDLSTCLRKYFYDVAMYQTVADEYLLERSHYRQSGIKTRRYNRGVFLSRPEADGPAVDSQGRYRPRKPDYWRETYGDKTPDWAQ